MHLAASASPILYQDGDWLVVNKPTGMSTHGATWGDVGAVEWLELHLGLSLLVCSRLDKPTSGALLFARHRAASARAQHIHERALATKTYIFASRANQPSNSGPSEWRVEIPLDGQPAMTHFRALGSAGAGAALYEATIHRGRRHQIRRHAAHCGLPILGDTDYGGALYPRLMLHCAQLEWPGVPHPIFAPLPESFAALGASTERAELAAALDRRLGWVNAVSNAVRVLHAGECKQMPIAIDKVGPFLFVHARSTYPVGPPSDVHAQIVQSLLQWWGCEAVWAPEVRAPWLTEHGRSHPLGPSPLRRLDSLLLHRDNRRRLERISPGLRVAEIGAAQGGFAAAAAASGAEVVFCVDERASHLNCVKADFAASALTESGVGKFVAQSSDAWLQRQGRKRTPNTPLLDAAVIGPRVPISLAAPLIGKGGAALLTSDTPLPNGQAEYFSQLESLRPPLDFPSTNPMAIAYWGIRADG